MFGFHQDVEYKEWTTFDGTPVLVPIDFNTEVDESGKLFQYPEADKSVPPSGVMPSDGFYFDAIVRQPAFDPNNLNVEDNLEDFSPVSDETLAYFEREIKTGIREYRQSNLRQFWRDCFRRYCPSTSPLAQTPQRYS